MITNTSSKWVEAVTGNCPSIFSIQWGVCLWCDQDGVYTVNTTKLQNIFGHQQAYYILSRTRTVVVWLQFPNRRSYWCNWPNIAQDPRHHVVSSCVDEQSMCLLKFWTVSLNKIIRTRVSKWFRQMFMNNWLMWSFVLSKAIHRELDIIVTAAFKYVITP